MFKDRITDYDDTMESVLNRLLIIEERFKTLTTKIMLLEQQVITSKKSRKDKEDD